jgi:hypothetical protein
MEMMHISYTDLTDFMHEDGTLVSEPGPAKAMAEYMASIVAMASYPDEEYPLEYIVKCRRRPKHSPCREMLVGFINDETDEIVWCCPKCNDRGTIIQWRGTLWDMSEGVSSH